MSPHTANSVPRSSPDRDPRNRARGVALLIVLACLVIVTVAAASLATTAVWSRQSRQAREAEALADELLVAAEGPIRRWLNERSALVVLPPDAAVPEVLVVSDRIVLSSASCELRVTAFDQCGMAPLALLDRVPLLRTAIPEEVLDAIADDPMPDPGSPGLDGWEGQARAFPEAASRLVTTEFAPPHGRVQPTGSVARPARPGPPAIGGSIATHNPAPGSNSLPLLNVGTAPIPLLEAAMRSEGVAGLEAIIQARAAGRRPTAFAERSDDASISFAPFSTCWAFRIDAEVGPVSKSWWSIYARSAAGWSLEQRLAIRE